MNTRELARLWMEEVWNQKNSAAIALRMDPSASGFTEGAEVDGPTQFKARLFDPFIHAFPDLHVRIDGIIADREEAVVRWTITGTHRGAFAHVEASGKRVQFSGMSWLRFRNDKIVEGSDSFNFHGLISVLSGGENSTQVQTVST